MQAVVAGHARGQRRDGRLEHAARGQQRLDELGLGLTLDQPIQHVGVEQMPLVAGSHRGAGALLGQHQPLGHQHAHRLAQYRPADVVVGQQLAFGGQAVAGLELAGHDAHAEVVHDARVHALALGRMAVIAVALARIQRRALGGPFGAGGAPGAGRAARLKPCCGCRHRRTPRRATHRP
jgi:hypothetical protein